MARKSRLGPPSFYATKQAYNEARRERKVLERLIKRNRLEQVQGSTEYFLHKHGKLPPEGYFTLAERRRMKAFFDRLDADKSGQISTDELIGPLLGVGMASSEADVRAFVNEVDTDHSGHVDFDEFMRAVEVAHKRSVSERKAHHRRHCIATRGSASLPLLATPAELSGSKRHNLQLSVNRSCVSIARAKHRGALPLVELQQLDCSENLDMAVRISINRRQRLLETIQTTLPNAAKIEELRHEEAQLRAKLYTEKYLQNTAEYNVSKQRLRQLHRECRHLQKANAHSAKLISALDHAIRIDQSALEQKRRSDAAKTSCIKLDDDASSHAPPTEEGGEAVGAMAADLHAHLHTASHCPLALRAG